MNSKSVAFDNDYNFKSVAEFKESLLYGREIVFQLNGIEYGIFFEGEDDKSYSIVHVGDKINIGEGYYTDSDGVHRNVESHEICTDIEGMYADTADEILEYTMDGDRLRDVVTEIQVDVRTI